MNEIREWIREMDTEEKRQVIESTIQWISLFGLVFMLAVIGG